MTARRAPVWLNVAVAAVATLVGLGVIEVALRVCDVDVASYHAIGGFTVYDPVLGWRLAPGRSAVFRGAHFSASVQQNAEGLRDRHYPYERTPGRPRVLVLGDSFVWCWGVAADECFTERLEAALAPAEVINAGVPAYSTAQAVLFYEREARRYRPDLVIHVVVPNDPIENVIGPGPRIRLVDGRLADPAAIAPRRKAVATEWLQAHSRVFAQLTYFVAVGRDALRIWRASGWPWRTATAGAADGGYVPGGALPPEGAWRLTEALFDRLDADIKADGGRLALVFEAMARPMSTRLLAYCAARGVPCLDLGPVLTAAVARGVRVRLWGDPHVGPAGQAVVSEAVRGFVEQERLLGFGALVGRGRDHSSEP